MCHAFIWMGRKGEVMGEGELGGVCVCVLICVRMSSFTRMVQFLVKARLNIDER